MKRIMEIPIRFNSNGLTIMGHLHKPNSKKNKYPAVVICHGYFQSNKIGPLALYVQLGKVLAANGIACLRIDLSGFGESEGNYMEASYISMYNDLLNAVKYLKKDKFIDHTKIGLIGHSLGGNIALDVASSNRIIKFLCLLSPNPTKSKSKTKIFSKIELNEMYKTGMTLRKGIPASLKVYKKINEGISFLRASEIEIESLIIYGEQDPYYSAKDYYTLANIFKTKPNIETINFADHNFLPLSSRADLINKIIKWISEVLTN